MLRTDVCAGFICCCYGRCWGWYVLGTLGAPGSLVHMGSASFASFPSCIQDSGYGGVPIA